MNVEVYAAILTKGYTLVGLSLIPAFENEPEQFCSSFCELFAQGSANIVCEGSVVTFVHPHEGEVSFSIDEKWRFAMHAFLSGGRGAVDLAHDYHAPCSTGFKLVLASMVEADVERINLARI